MKVGIAGTGRMGTAIGRRLLSLGHELRVWNRTATNAQALVDAGAARVDRPRTLADTADVVLTLLTDAPAVEAVYHGESGLFAGDARGKLFIEMSTVRPLVARTLAEQARTVGAALIDCPIGGSVGPASAGTLLGLAGGDVADVERARPLLAQLCRRIEHIGPIGAGATVKLAMNLTTQIYWQSFGEALALCAPLALAPERLMELFMESSGAARVLQHRAADIVTGLAGREILPVNFDIDSVRKDLRAIVAEAHATGRTLPLAERVLQVYDQVSREGHGGRDCCMMPALWALRPHG